LAGCKVNTTALVTVQQTYKVMQVVTLQQVLVVVVDQPQL
jgi:hypothetical protein